MWPERRNGMTSVTSPYRPPSTEASRPTSNQAWPAQVQEGILEVALPICAPTSSISIGDFHEQQVAARCFLDEVWADIARGHNGVSTVFIERGAMYEASGPEALLPGDATQFVNGGAAVSASGGYGRRHSSRPRHGIVGHACRTLDTAVGTVLAAPVQAGDGRFRGIRHAAAWDPHPEMRKARAGSPPV